MIKLVFIFLVWILLIVFFKVSGFRVTLSLFFFIFLGRTWNYKVLKDDVNSDIDDYYSLFELKHDFSKTELEQAYNNEIEKLSNNLSIGLEYRIQLMALLNTAFDTLNDSHSRNEYDVKYKMYSEELQKSKLRADEISNDFWKYVKGLCHHVISPFIHFNFKSKETIGLLACVILDLFFLLPQWVN